VVLLRVLEPVTLPSDSDLLRTRIEHNQRRTDEEVFGVAFMTDTIRSRMPSCNTVECGCRILGTFYLDNGQLRLGSDLGKLYGVHASAGIKPSPAALELIVNHVNPEILQKARDEARKAGFVALPPPLEIGTIRYTSTARLHRRADQQLAPVRVQPTDFFARRTAVLGHDPHRQVKHSEDRKLRRCTWRARRVACE
jgi:hypothetical protein